MRSQLFNSFRRPLLAALALVAQVGAEPVTVLEIPDHGVQPQALVDSKGVLHVIYLAGPAPQSDVFHTTLDAKTKTFAKPQRVNHTAGNAMAVGTIRGAQAAFGRDDRLHVVWNGSVMDADGKRRSDVLYTRSDGKGGFDNERALMHLAMHLAMHLDGGCTIAADAAGNVHAMWHAIPTGAPPKAGEAARIIYASSSHDEGATFAEEKPLKATQGGVCGCCSMRAAALPSGEVFALYRNADGKNRGIQMLASKDGAVTFNREELQPWPVNVCPMSSSFLLPTSKGMLAAWETDNTIWMADLGGAKPSPVKVSGGKSKHPSIARNARGETLLAWAVGTGWQRGGAVAWSLLDGQGKVTAQSSEPRSKRETPAGKDNEVPVWSHPAAADVKGLGFVVLH